MQTLAAVGDFTTYADLSAATGIDPKLLNSNVGALKRRGLVERLNEGEFDQAPVFAITPEGVAYLRGGRPGRRVAAPEAIDDTPAEPAEPIVAHAIRTRPPLAMVWGCA